jgi:putative hydrolase of the HAD superfamily
LAGKYKHIYFDLDRTIWDFEGNSVHTLRDLQEKFDLTHIDSSEFHKTFNYYNELHWQMFREGRINKEDLRQERFRKTLEKFEINDRSLAEKVAIEYLKIGPTKTGLLPYAKEVLDKLHKTYSLYIITNGFNDIQIHKLTNSGVIDYFKKVITSEHARSSKPKQEIFQYALTAANAKKKESLMVGDDLEIDILGAKAFGMDQVYFNPAGLQHNESVTYEIQSLLELTKILL